MMKLVPLHDEEISAKDENSIGHMNELNLSAMGSIFRQIIKESNEKIFNTSSYEVEFTSIDDKEFNQIISELRKSGTITNYESRQHKETSNVSKIGNRINGLKEYMRKETTTEFFNKKSTQNKIAGFFDEMPSFFGAATKSLAQSTKDPIYKRTSSKQMKALKRVSLFKLEKDMNANYDYDVSSECSEESERSHGDLDFTNNHTSKNNFFLIACEESEINGNNEMIAKASSRRNGYIFASIEDVDGIEDKVDEFKCELLEDFPRRYSSLTRISFVVKLDEDDIDD